MSDAAKTSAEAIASLLTGLAGAVTDAQAEMAEMPPTDAFGRPLPVYQIPHLDFSFEIEIERATEGDDGRSFWSLLPAAKPPKDKISSTISGRIVAVPPNGGLPETRILVTQSPKALTVQLVNAAGEILPDALVELEFDAASSEALHKTDLTPAKRLRLLGSQQVSTNAEGVATAPVRRSVLPQGKSAVVLIRAGGAETRVSVKREG